MNMRDSNSNSDKVKVLIVAPGAPLVGGQAVQAKRIASNFASENEVDAQIQKSNPQINGPLNSIKFLGTILREIKFSYQLLRTIPKNDVVHVFSGSHFSFILSTIPPFLIAKLFGKRTILNYRSGAAEQFFNGWGKYFLPMVRRFDAVVAPSNYLVDVFKQFDVNVKSISNFIAPEKYIFRDRNPLRPIFLSNRILEPLYNIDCILKAFEIIQQKYPNARLIVTHEGPEEQRLKKVTKDMGLRNVDFLGLVPHERVAELYDSVDIYLNAPDHDCMPGSLVECMASGLPIVSTNAGGIPYIVKDDVTALLIELNDHEAMARCSIELLENRDLVARLVKNAFSESRNYVWNDVGKQWVALYRELAKRNTDSTVSSKASTPKPESISR